MPGIEVWLDIGKINWRFWSNGHVFVSRGACQFLVKSLNNAPGVQLRKQWNNRLLCKSRKPPCNSGYVDVDICSTTSKTRRKGLKQELINYNLT